MTYAGGPVEEIRFSWKGFASEVLLTGDFLNWDVKVPLTRGADDVFTVAQVLAQNKIIWFSLPMHVFDKSIP